MDFLNLISNNFNKIKAIFIKKSNENGMNFDEDIFSDTILKCHESLKDKELTEKEMLGYFWSAFKINSIREPLYHRNSTTGRIPEGFDVIDQMETNTVLVDKYKNVTDLIREEFGDEILELFEMHVNGSTYEELAKITKIKNLKYVFRKVRNHVRNQMG